MEEKKPQKVSFELTRAEFLNEEERGRVGTQKGLVVIEKTAHSYPEVQLHAVGDEGIVGFIKKLEERK